MANEAGAARPRSELVLRVVSSLVLVPMALAAVAIGGWALGVLVAAVAALAFREFTGIVGGMPAWLRIAGALCLGAGILAVPFRLVDAAMLFIALPAFLLLGIGYRNDRFRWAGFGMLYVAIPCAGIIILREPEAAGRAAVLFVMLATWATDTGGYFGGRSIGGPKLCPRISPKKTWSGALAGTAAAGLAGGLTAWWTGHVTPLAGIALAIALSAAAQAGDLLESAIKRHFGVKDSGHLIPGHGGILDRVDGLFAAAALAWLIAGLGLGGDLLVLPDFAVDPGESP